MIALDTSAFARFLDDPLDSSTDIVADALSSRTAHLPPVVVSELLSNHRLSDGLAALVLSVPLLPMTDEGYWMRVGRLRAGILGRGLRAGLADCLIAQSCIDNDIPLITYDRDFRHFAVAGLKLA